MRRAGRFEEQAHGPEGQPARTLTASADVFIGGKTKGAKGTEPEVRFHLHLDSDRDGEVDDDWRGNERWEWTREGFGAVVLPCLTPAQPRRPEQIAPLTIRRDPATRGRSADGWKAELWADNPHKLTLLSGRGADAKPLTSPFGVTRVPIDLSQDEHELGMEATQHPGPHLGKGRDADPNAKNPAWLFEGLVKLYLKVWNPATGAEQTETALVRVAPWIGLTHFDPTEVVYVSEHAPAAGIKRQLDDVPQKTFKLTTIPMRVDRWTQDQGEIGFTQAPHDEQRAEARTELLSLKNSTLREFLRKDMSVLDTVDVEVDAGGSGGDSINYGGNIECVPPFVHEGTKRVYAFGRIYYGAPVADPRYADLHKPLCASLRLFFQKQSMQEPFTIDTGWLSVGHVDEVVSVLPMRDARLGFRVLIASPSLALELLEPIDDRTPAFGIYARTRDSLLEKIIPHYLLFTGSKEDEEDLINATTIDAGFLKGKTRYNVCRYDFINRTPAIEEKLASVRSAFKDAVGLRDDDFIRLPVLFAAYPEVKAPDKPGPLDSIAFTPGLVNGLVITRGAPTWAGERSVTFLAPKPFGPIKGAGGSAPAAPNDCVFEEYVRNALGPPSTTGVEVQFADDFEGYHLLDGEVHCGTNSRRTPPTDRRWWAPRENTRKSKGQ